MKKRKHIVAEMPIVMRERWRLDSWAEQAGRGPDKGLMARHKLLVSDESHRMMGGVPNETINTYAGAWPGFRRTAADRKEPREVVVHPNDYPPVGWPFPGDEAGVDAWNTVYRHFQEVR